MENTGKTACNDHLYYEIYWSYGDYLTTGYLDQE